VGGVQKLPIPTPPARLAPRHLPLHKGGDYTHKPTPLDQRRALENTKISPSVSLAADSSLVRGSRLKFFLIPIQNLRRENHHGRSVIAHWAVEEKHRKNKRRRNLPSPFCSVLFCFDPDRHRRIPIGDSAQYPHIAAIHCDRLSIDLHEFGDLKGFLRQ